MKKNIIIILCIIIVILLTLFIWYKWIYNKTEVPQKVEILQIVLGEKFTLVDELKDKYILDYSLIDLDNDNCKDDIILVGEKEKQSDTFAKNMNLVVRNGNNGKYNICEVIGVQGYQSHIGIFDVTNDGTLDIAIFSNLGRRENAINVAIFKYEKNTFTQIFALDNSKNIDITGQYLDSYQAQITVNNFNKTFVADISDKKQYYIRNKIYDENDKLIKDNISIKSKKANMLEQIELQDGVYGIKTIQNLIGIDKTDIIDVIEVKWKYEKNEFVIYEIIGERCGRLL